ncbi:MAG: DUF2922 domain-containing protein [Aerococcus sp.]|nr:DUF2922 domain-containing protein [Aerococcus sp.]
MEKQLELQFNATDGKMKKIVIRNPKPDIDQETAKNAMTTIQAQDAFVDDKGQHPYHELRRAVYITRQVDEVFEAPKAAKPDSDASDAEDPSEA